MSYQETRLKEIADVIREKKGTTTPIKATEFANEIRLIGAKFDNLDITENGEYDIEDYKKVTVVVPIGDVIPLIEGGLSDTFSIPYGVTKIKASCFANEKSLRTVSIPSSVTEIGDSAFYYCSNLKPFTIPESVKKIGSKAFQYISSWGTMIFPAGVTLGSYVCSAKKVIIGENSTIGSNAFYQESLESIEIGEGTTIGSSAFFQCHNLTEVVLPESLTVIPSSLFYQSSGIKKVKVSSQLTTIESYAFGSCGNFEEIELPETLTEIKASAFYSTSKNTTNGLTIVMNATTPPTLGYNALSNAKINKIYVPKGTREAYINATNWSTMADYIIEPCEIVLSVPTSILNSDLYTYSLDVGKTWSQFTSQSLYFEDISVVKFKSTDSSKTLLIGTTEGGNDIGTIANAELSYAIPQSMTIYISEQ